MAQVCFSEGSLVILFIAVIAITVATLVFVKRPIVYSEVANTTPVQQPQPLPQTSIIVSSPPQPAPQILPVVPEQNKNPSIYDIVFGPAVPQPQRQPQQITIVPPGGYNTGPTSTYISQYDLSYHDLGYVEDTTASSSPLRMRLFGHRKYPRTERYEYYIVDPNGIKIPFTTKNEAEIFDGDLITIPGYTQTFKANIYGTDNNTPYSWIDGR